MIQAHATTAMEVTVPLCPCCYTTSSTLALAHQQPYTLARYHNTLMHMSCVSDSQGSPSAIWWVAGGTDASTNAHADTICSHAQAHYSRYTCKVHARQIKLLRTRPGTLMATTTDTTLVVRCCSQAARGTNRCKERAAHREGWFVLARQPYARVPP